MILEAIEKDPWAAVQLPLPLDANRQLLAAARSAAQLCEGEAWRMIRTHDREDADSVGYAAEMQFMAREAAGRVGEIEDKLAALAAPVRPSAASLPGLARMCPPNTDVTLSAI